jgi:hypothetical protein
MECEKKESGYLSWRISGINDSRDFAEEGNRRETLNIL